jgi:hypothetical protein
MACTWTTCALPGMPGRAFFSWQAGERTMPLHLAFAPDGAYVIHIRILECASEGARC